MMNPPNPNKFIGLRDQQTMGQMMDPLQAEQDFLANRMSQPVPVPGGQTPMMQTNAGVKQRAMQPLPKPDMADNRLERTTTKIEQVPQQNAPLKQANFPHSDQKYTYKPGDLMDETDFEETTFNSSRAKGSVNFPGIHGDDYSDIQIDRKGQYMTSLGSEDGEFIDQKRPTSSTHRDFLGKIVDRDTLRPDMGQGSKFKSLWQTKASQANAFRQQDKNKNK